ncbi:MAG: TetR/AcrR family transcriptional regulator [Chloroflexi bacterium]|nr:TetR/AcrR family transcriptional regulator [Chloroflexota bacterium]
MAKLTETATEPRTPLNRERVLAAAVTLADSEGIESLSMRKLAHELGVEAMSLYNHVTNKQDILDGVVDFIVNEITTPADGADWKTAIRHKAMSAREALRRHPWAAGVIATRTDMTPTMLKYFDSGIGVLLDGGFSADLAHHAVHALGSRFFGFTQELFDSEDDSNQEVTPLLIQQMAGEYPNLAEMMTAAIHDDDSIVGLGCDDQFEFEFALDLILDGLERLRDGA